MEIIRKSVLWLIAKEQAATGRQLLILASILATFLIVSGVVGNVPFLFIVGILIAFVHVALPIWTYAMVWASKSSDNSHGTRQGRLSALLSRFISWMRRNDAELLMLGMFAGCAAIVCGTLWFFMGLAYPALSMQVWDVHVPTILCLGGDILALISGIVFERRRALLRRNHR